MTRKRIAKIAGAFALCTLLLISACGSKRGEPSYPERTKPPGAYAKKELKRMGYTIQAGAFANVDNAARLTERLRSQGLDATYFAARTGLYKVRFGNFNTKYAAKKRARSLQAAGTIEVFYVVAPEDYSVAKSEKKGLDQENYLRLEIVKVAHSFIDVPYLWGGASVEDGFDCSGLTMTVYQLNGLNLPRNSSEQYQAGNPIAREELTIGDLVFFDTMGKGRVSHVGIYVGDGEFIHAPKKGRTICRESMTEGYYLNHYVGACSYL